MSTYSPVLQLSDQEVRMFLREVPTAQPAWRRFLLTVIGVSLGTAAIFVLMNLQAFLQLAGTPATARALNGVPAPTVQPAASATAQPTPSVQLPDNTVSVPSLGVSAPVSWNIPLNDSLVHAKLEDGVVHIAGTALPGEKGMATVVGHSSNYFWDKGQYNTVFAPLLQVQNGAEVDLNYKGKVYVYKVTGTKVVKPTDVGVLDDNSQVGIRLITCTPLGTALNRLVVDATQVYPDPGTAAPFAPTDFTGAIPAIK